MSASEIISGASTLLEIKGIIYDKVVGFDEKIRRKFVNALKVAMQPTVKDNDWYINNAARQIDDLISFVILVMDEPPLINTIALPSYITREEFRRFYTQTNKDEELQNFLQVKLNQYQNKKIFAEVKTTGQKVDILIEKKEQLRGNTGESDADPIRDLYKCLDEKLHDKREKHPSFQLMKIDDRLFPNAQTKQKHIKLEALDSNDKLKTVRNIIEESWGKGKQNHLMIEGDGGIGKTVTLLSIPDTEKFAPHYVPAIYIPLHELYNGEDPIEHYIKKKILKNKGDLYEQLLDLVDQPWDNGPRLLLLLDGFNEISPNQRVPIGKDIVYWSEYSGIQIITSSRYDIHTHVAFGDNCSALKLQALSDTTVEEFLRSMDIPIPTDDVVRKLITTPLLLTLYAKTKLVLERRECDASDFKEVKNAGSIVWNYLQCELWNFGKEGEDAKNAIIAMEFIAPYMAWRMQQKTLFVLNKKEFHDFLEGAYQLLEKHFNKREDFPFHIQDAIQQANEKPRLDSIRGLLENKLCLFVRNGNDYRLMHQQFRDALAAIHLINLSYLSGDSLPKEWESPIDYYVMQFVANLISEEEATRLWEQNRNIQPTHEDATRNQLRLQGLLHNNDFSRLDFSGLDLSDISLYSYRNSKAIIKLPTQQARMVNTKISKKTFSPEGHEDWVFAVAVTPDGKRIVSGSRDCTIRVWDLASCAAIGEPIEAHKKWVTAVAVAPNGNVVSGSDDGTIRVWDMNKGTEIRTIYGHKDRVTAVVVTQDGKWIVSGSVDSTIRVWDLETGAAIGNPLKGHKSRVNSIAVTSDRKLIVSGSADSTIRVWDMENGGAIKKLIKGHDGWVTAVAVTPDGTRIVSGSVDLTIRVWNLNTGAAMLPPVEGHQYSVSAIAVTVDSKLIVSGSWDCTIRVWNLDTGAAILPPLKGHQNLVTTIAVTSDKERIVSGSWDRTIRVWDLATGAAIVKTIEEGHKKLVRAVAVTADEKYIVSSSGDCINRVWDLETGTAIGKLVEGHEGRMTAVAVTPDGKHIVSGSGDGTIRVWDMATGEAIKNPLKGHKSKVTAVAVTPKGIVVSGSDDGTIRVWDIDNGTEIRTIYGHESRVTAVAVTPNGKRIVSVSWGTICVWDMESGKAIVKPIEGRYYDSVSAVAVTQDGKRIVVRSWDYFIRVWDLATGVAIENNIDGHKLWGNAVILISNKERIVCDEDTISITDTETRKVKTIKIHPLSFVGLDFSLADISDAELKETLRQNGAKV